MPSARCSAAIVGLPSWSSFPHPIKFRWPSKGDPIATVTRRYSMHSSRPIKRSLKPGLAAGLRGRDPDSALRDYFARSFFGPYDDPATRSWILDQPALTAPPSRERLARQGTTSGARGRNMMSNHILDNAAPTPDYPDSLLECPTCALPAEITDRFTLDGAPAPVEHVKLLCVQRHWYTLPVDQLPLSAPVPDKRNAQGSSQPG